MRRLLCKAFGHHRNSHGVRRAGGVWRSTCINCNEPLYRVSHGNWQLFAEIEPTDAEQLELLSLLDPPVRPPAPP